MFRQCQQQYSHSYLYEITPYLMKLQKEKRRSALERHLNKEKEKVVVHKKRKRKENVPLWKQSKWFHAEYISGGGECLTCYFFSLFSYLKWLCLNYFALCDETVFITMSIIISFIVFLHYAVLSFFLQTRKDHQNG